jgi:putative transposase
MKTNIPPPDHKGFRSDGAAKRESRPGVEQRQHKGLNTQAENSHQPTRLREKTRRKVKSAKHAQRFLSAFGPLSQQFQPPRQRLSAREDLAIFPGRFQTCNDVTRGKLLGSLLNILSPCLLSLLFPLLHSAISFL